MKFHTTVDRWSLSLGLLVALVFGFFDAMGQSVDAYMLAMVAGYWVVATATLGLAGRCESVVMRVVILSAGSFVLILGPWLVPYPLR